MSLVFPQSRKRRYGLPSLTLIAAALATFVAPPLAAQQSAVVAAAPTANAAAHDDMADDMIHMLQLLQKRKALPKKDAEAMIRHLQERQSAQAAANAQAAATAATTAAAQQAKANAAAAADAVATAAATAPAEPAVEQKGDVRVMYVPESQLQKIREQVKQEVLASAQSENWAQAHGLPTWTQRISFSGDFRFRNEFDLYDSQNGTFINFSAINSGNPYDVNSGQSSNRTPPPTFDTTQDRERPRIRARIAMDAVVADDLSASFRFTSGNINDPVTTDQTLGSDFNKLSFFIDRAYLDYHPLKELNVWAGRMPDPWFAPTNLAWYQDLAFDGIAAQFHGGADSQFKPFATIGAFSVENTTLDFPVNSVDKVRSRDKWLYAAQAGFEYAFNPGLKVKEGLAYYYFSHLAGQLSSPCVEYSNADACDTDDSRSGFLQKGNTVFAIRSVAANSAYSDPSTQPQYQYFGLASQFRELDLTLQVDKLLSGPLHLVVSGEAVANLGFNRRAVLSKVPVNNFGEATTAEPDGRFIGGRYGGQLQFQAGYPEVREFGQWFVIGGYRILDSDAVVDAFTDSDFNLGGTNTKGYYIHGAFGFTHNAWLMLKWFSANEVNGPPLAIDVLQLDVNARF